MNLHELAEKELKSKPRYKIKSVWNQEYASDHEAMEAMYRHAVKAGLSWQHAFDNAESAPADYVEQQLGQFVRMYLQHKYQLTLDSLLKESSDL